MTAATDPADYVFDRCHVSPARRAVWVDGRPGKLGARAFDVLLALIERRDRVVSKNDLLDIVWPKVVVEEGNLLVHIWALRKLLGHQAITTIPGRGYRFTAALDGGHAQPAQLPSAQSGMEIAAGSTGQMLRTNLPQALPALIGRDDDVAALSTLVAQNRLVTIIGAGGMGKTRLAQHLLSRQEMFGEHGACWVELAGLSDPELVASAIVSTLGLQIGSNDSLSGLVAALKGMKLLLALDNAEHLVDKVACVAQALVAGAPYLHLLITSQVPLKCSGERVYRLGSLAVPEDPVAVDEAATYGAVALFVERARAVGRHFVLTADNVGMIVDVCRQLDGMALAIELAAARIPHLGIAKLASTLCERLRVLTGGRRDAPERQRTLRAALEWSCSFLNEREQAALRRLAVIAGSASLNLVQQVVADQPGEGELDEWALLDALGLLVDRSLVVVLNTDDAGAPRYRLLDSQRAYALELLAAGGEMEALRRRHALAVLGQLDAAERAVESGRIGVEAWQRANRFDLDNAREAFNWARAAGENGLALAIGSALLTALPRSMHFEITALADACETLAAPDVPSPLRRSACGAISRALVNISNLRSRVAAEQALVLAQALDSSESDRYPLYRALCRCAKQAAIMFDADTAERMLEQSRPIEDPTWPPVRLRLRAEAEAWAAKPADALRWFRHLVALERAAGGNGHLALMNIADTQLLLGDSHAAVRSGIELLTRLEQARDEYGLAYARLNLAAAYLSLDDLANARTLLRDGWPLALRFDLHSWCVEYMALLAVLDGRPRAAARLAGSADGRYAAHNEHRHANESVARERTRALASATLGDPEFERLKAESVVLSDDDVVRLAFGTEEDLG